MKVNSSNLRLIEGAKKQAATERANSSPPGAQPKGSGEVGTARSTGMSRLVQAVRDAGRGGHETAEAQVAAIRAAITNGTYNIDAGGIADAMITETGKYHGIS